MREGCFGNGRDRQKAPLRGVTSVLRVSYSSADILIRGHDIGYVVQVVT